MKELKIRPSTEEFEKALKEMDDQKYVLRLYVTGQTSKSRRAMEVVEKICKEHLKGPYDLEIIDIYQHPERANEEDIIAVPVLIKKLPMPLRKFIGDLSDMDSVLEGLGLFPK